MEESPNLLRKPRGAAVSPMAIRGLAEFVHGSVGVVRKFLTPLGASAGALRF